MIVLMVAMGLALGYLLSDWLRLHIEGCKSFFEATCAGGLVLLVNVIPAILIDNSDIRIMLIVSTAFLALKTIYNVYNIYFKKENKDN